MPFRRKHRVGGSPAQAGFRAEWQDTSIDARAAVATGDCGTMILTRADWEARAAFTSRRNALRSCGRATPTGRTCNAWAACPRWRGCCCRSKPRWPEAHVRALDRSSAVPGPPGLSRRDPSQGRSAESAPVIGSLGIGRNPGAPASAAITRWAASMGQGLCDRGDARLPGSTASSRFPELDAIDAAHFVDNPASGHVLRKLGFRIDRPAVSARFRRAA